MVTTAEQANRNAHAVQAYPRGYCLRYVRQQWQVGPLYSSAIAAWNGARHKHPGDRNPPTGAPCYYAGGRYGHIVFHCPRSHVGVRSTDCYTSGRVSDADLEWCERAWGYRYLGWTEDLNGVRVIPEEEDEMGYREWSDADKAALARDVTDAVWSRAMQVTKPDGSKAAKEAGRILRETWSKLSQHIDAGG